MKTKNENKNEQPANTTPASSPATWPHGPNRPVDGKVRVTPEMAREWIKANRNNRPVRRGAVAKITADLKRDDFLYTGQTILFTISWRLADGQHRLIAIIESGIPAEVMVVTGIEDRAIAKIDNGGAGPRSPAIAWRMSNDIAGDRTEDARIASCWIGLYGVAVRDPETFGRAYAAFSGGVHAMSEVFGARDRGLFRAPIVAAFAVAWKEAPQATVELAMQYAEGAMLPASHPMLVMARHFSVPRRSSGGSMDSINSFRKAISLIAAGLDGTRRGQARGMAGEEILNRFIARHDLPRRQSQK